MESGVSIDELSVNIKTIKVNSNKMTLSVFKQLPYEEIVDYRTLTLNGIHWGGSKLLLGWPQTLAYSYCLAKIN